jgi:WD40 repeat protein
MLTLLVSAFAYYFAVYVPAQTPAETQSQPFIEKPASTEPVVQSSSEQPALTNAQEPLPTNSPTPTGTPETVLAASQSITATAMVISEENVTQVAPLYVLTGHTDDVTEVTFSPDNSLVASSSSDGTVQLWNVGDGSLQYVLEGHTDSVNTLDFSPDGSLLASGSNDGTVRIWQVSDGTLVRTISSKDNQQLITGSSA